MLCAVLFVSFCVLWHHLFSRKTGCAQHLAALNNSATGNKTAEPKQQIKDNTLYYQCCIFQAGKLISSVYIVIIYIVYSRDIFVNPPTPVLNYDISVWENQGSKMYLYRVSQN